MFRCSRCSRPNARCERSRIHADPPNGTVATRPVGQPDRDECCELGAMDDLLRSGHWGDARFHPGFPPTDGLRPQDAVAFLHQTTRILDPHLRGVR